MRKICIISSDPDFLGGVSLYTLDSINEILKESGKKSIFWIYEGNKNRTYSKNGIKFIEIKSVAPYPLKEIIFNLKIKRFLDNHFFDVINSHAIWGFWMSNYRKKENQKIIHTYHGSTYHFFKNHLKRYSLIKKISALFSMQLGIFMEKPPWIKADEIICVSKHVKEELENLYGKRENVKVMHAKIDLKAFKPRNKSVSKVKIGLDKDKFYGLYVGRGGFWTKGLDRVINISREIYEKDKKYRILVVGSDIGKIKNIAKEDFVITLPPISRENLPYYYNSSDLFFNLSRYEGGDPTLSTAEAMASGCLVICSKDARQEIIKNGENGLVIEDFNAKTAKLLLSYIKNKKIIRNSVKTIQKFSK